MSSLFNILKYVVIKVIKKIVVMLSINILFNYYKSKKIEKFINTEIDSNNSIRFWWRDDDVFDDTQELNKLLNFSTENNLPAYLSVIPKNLSDGAIAKIKEHRNISVMQHGYSHINYANIGEPLNEFGNHRSLDTQFNKIQLGFDKLRISFGEQFIPVFVPPWHHISESVLEQLYTVGIKEISLIGDGDKNYPNLINKNVDIDIFSWKTQSETSYEVNIRDYGQILDDFYNKIILNNNNSITIAIVTHSQIMNKQDWKIFGKLIMILKKTKIEFIGRNNFLDS